MFLIAGVEAEGRRRRRRREGECGAEEWVGRCGGGVVEEAWGEGGGGE